MKKIIFLIIVAALAGGIYWFMTSFESIVKKLVHQYGSEVTQTSVDINGLKLALTDGQATIKSITVANPKGYETPYIFALDEITVKVNIKSITTDTIIIDKVEVKKPVVTYEMVSLQKNNINDILNNVNGYSARKAKEAKAAPTEAKEEGPSKKVIIKKLVIDQGQLVAFANLSVADLKVPLKNNKVTVKLPQIVMTDIGQSSGGKDIAGTVSDIITKVLTTASQTALGANLGDLQGLVQDNVKLVTGTVDEVNKQAKGTVDDVKKTVNDLGGLVGDTVNIFK